MKIKKFYRDHLNNPRDPRYVFVLIISAFLLLVSTLQVLGNGTFDSVERPIFEFFNSWPKALHGLLFAMTQFGGMGSLPIWIGFAWYVINKRAAISVLFTGFLGWTMAKVAKVVIQRDRPGSLLDSINLFNGETFSGFGFPSGHATFSSACATILYFQVPRKFRKYLLLVVLLVGISRIYLGAHFPLDIVGGWSLGACIGATVSLAIGVSRKGLSITQVRNFLKKKGYEVASLNFASVDARGSMPFFLELGDRKKYFGKLFGKQEHAADWLFKLFRFFRYKNLQAEEPHINSGRNVQLEAFAMLWAKQHRVRTPKILDLMRFGSSWMLIQERIDAEPLSERRRILRTSLISVWRQMSKLHQCGIAHRDLRTANVLIDRKGDAWIIDFGFAEVSADKQRQYMDVAELLMSMSLVVGIDRTIESASEVLSPQKLKKSMPFLQKAVFSGETTKQLRGNRTLEDLQSALSQKLRLKTEIKHANIERISVKKLVNLVLVASFVYVVAPQFSEFEDVLWDINLSYPIWLLPIALASALTYVLTGAIYVSLSQVPLKLRQATLVQLAASFMSKVLPGGMGNLGVNSRYLNKSGLEPAETSAIITAQVIIGFVMFTIPLGIFLILSGHSLTELFNLEIKPVYIITLLIVLGIFVVGIMFIRKLRLFISSNLLKFTESVRALSTPSRELFWAAVSSFAVTLTYVFCLYMAFRAFGVDLGFTAAVFVYASAVIARSTIPTPGGLGPLEAAMIAVMITLGVSNSEAFSVVLLYRLSTFWLPIPFSLLSYRYLVRKRII